MSGVVRGNGAAEPVSGERSEGGRVVRGWAVGWAVGVHYFTGLPLPQPRLAQLPPTLHITLPATLLPLKF